MLFHRRYLEPVLKPAPLEELLRQFRHPPNLPINSKMSGEPVEDFGLITLPDRLVHKGKFLTGDLPGTYRHCQPVVEKNLFYIGCSL